MQIGISKQHFQHLKKLTSNLGRKSEGSFLIAGEAILSYAVNSKSEILGIYSNDERKLNDYNQFSTFLIDGEFLSFFSETGDTQNIFAEVKKKDLTIDDAFGDSDEFNRWLILDGIQDPGNLGTIIRSANAFGYQNIIASKRTTDFFSQKTLRSMKGANFYTNIFENQDLLVWIKKLQQNGVTVYGTLVNPSATPLLQIKKEPIHALVLGNEGKGMSSELSDIVDKNIYIEMTGNQDSLNVAISGAIVMHQFAN